MRNVKNAERGSLGAYPSWRPGAFRRPVLPAALLEGGRAGRGAFTRARQARERVKVAT